MSKNRRFSLCGPNHASNSIEYLDNSATKHSDTDTDTPTPPPSRRRRKGSLPTIVYKVKNFAHLHGPKDSPIKRFKDRRLSDSHSESSPSRNSAAEGILKNRDVLLKTSMTLGVLHSPYKEHSHFKQRELLYPVNEVVGKRDISLSPPGTKNKNIWMKRNRSSPCIFGARGPEVRGFQSESSSEDEDEEDVGDSGRDDVANTLKVLSAKLEDLRTCHDLIMKHGQALQKSLAELEAIDSTEDLPIKTKTVNERATLFRISSNAMINACNDYVDVSSSAGRKWQRLLQHERDQRLRLEDMVEQLARQHSHLEQEAKEHQQLTTNSTMTPGHSHSEDEEENEFEDAVEELAENFIVHVNTGQHKRSDSNVSQLSEEMSSVNGSQATTPTEIIKMAQSNGQPKRVRRTRVPEKPQYPLNLWSIMKNCIGKELSKIPMPVNFSEPLSFLQRLTEDFEYSDVLDRAAQCEDSCEQLSWVAAFTVSAYATTAVRTAKPFNPLLGETFECDRMDDMGWRAINEQVSHHPPVVAQHVEGRTGWESWQEFSMSSKFRGKYLQIIPLGIAHLRFNNTGNLYSWRKVSTTVHNMIVGKLWLDNHGEMEITNHKTGDKCCLKFIPYSYFSRDTPKKVTGYVVDSEGVFKWFITGMWDEKIEACRVTSQTMRGGKPVYETGPPKMLWKRNVADCESEKIYNFTELACQLNEMEDSTAPTDSRLRPDQRFMENGEWDEANTEKLRLEEKQRAVRRQREAEAEAATTEDFDGELTCNEYPSYEPNWFCKEDDETSGTMLYKYKYEYWESKEKQEWSRCPDIF